MRILIVEDEEIVARRLQRLLRSIRGERDESVHRVATMHDARLWLREHPIDLLLLDLNLNGRDGFEILGEVVAGSFQTIIVSAHVEQAIRAFDYGVTDFIAKPYTEERLRAALTRVTARSAAPGHRLRYLAVRKASEIRLVPVEEVVLIRGAGDYSELHTRDGSMHLHDKSLALLERLLPERFLRVHRSYLVDVGEIESLRSEPGSRYFARLRSQREIPIGRSRLERLRSLLA